MSQNNWVVEKDGQYYEQYEEDGEYLIRLGPLKDATRWGKYTALNLVFYEQHSSPYIFGQRVMRIKRNGDLVEVD